MTVSPTTTLPKPSDDAMCSETNVTITSIKVRSSSCSELGTESSQRPRRASSPVHSTAELTMMPQLSATSPVTTSQRSPTSPEAMTPQRTRAASSPGDAVGEGNGGLRLTSISETVAPSSPPKTSSLDDEVFEVNGVTNSINTTLWAIPPSTGNASVDECAKLVYQLSRELAILDALSLGIGGDTDTDRLREELRLCQHRSCSLSQQNAASLVPLLRSKSSLKKEETAQVERLYRIYSGCLEYLVYLLHKLRSLLCLFHLHNDTCYLIQTGLTDPLSFVPKTSCVQRDGAPGHLSGEGPSSNQILQSSHLLDEPTRLARDIQTIQHLLCVVNNASDVQPWDVGEDGLDVPKLGASSTNASKRSRTRTVTFQDDGRRRQRFMCMLAVMVTIILLIAVVVIASLFTSS